VVALTLVPAQGVADPLHVAYHRRLDARQILGADAESLTKISIMMADLGVAIVAPGQRRRQAFPPYKRNTNSAVSHLLVDQDQQAPVGRMRLRSRNLGVQVTGSQLARQYL